MTKKSKLTDNYTILPDLNMISYCCGLYDGAGSDMNMVSYFHRIVIEISTIRFVGGPIRVLICYIFQWYEKRTYLMTQPSPTRQYLPKEITTACPGPVRLRSPRIIAPLEMMVFPPRIIFCGPAIVARLETLLPVS